MEEKKNYKKSQIRRIEAAVLAILERYGFDIEETGTEKSEKNPGNWIMYFFKEATTKKELDALERELGEKLSIALPVRKKKSVSISIEAPAEEFEKILTREMTGSSQSGGTAPRPGTPNGYSSHQ